MNVTSCNKLILKDFRNTYFFFLSKLITNQTKVGAFLEELEYHLFYNVIYSQPKIEILERDMYT